MASVKKEVFSNTSLICLANCRPLHYISLHAAQLSFWLLDEEYRLWGSMLGSTRNPANYHMGFVCCCFLGWSSHPWLRSKWRLETKAVVIQTEHVHGSASVVNELRNKFMGSNQRIFTDFGFKVGIKLEPYATPEGAGKEFLSPDSDGLTHGFGFRDCGGRVGYMLYTVQGEGFGR